MMKAMKRADCPVGSFEAWKLRPVYVAQCHSAALAARLGIRNHRFRCLPAYRDEQALADRKRVADVIRAERTRLASIKVVRALMAVSGQHDSKTGHLVDCEANFAQRLELNRLRDQQVVAYKNFTF